MMNVHNSTVPLTSWRVLLSWFGGTGTSDDDDDERPELFDVRVELRLGNANGSDTLFTLPLTDDLSEVEPVLLVSCFSTLK